MVCLVMAETAARSMEHRLRTPSGGKQADGRDPWSSGKGLREHRGHVWCWDGPKGCSVQKNLMGGGGPPSPAVARSVPRVPVSLPPSGEVLQAPKSEPLCLSPWETVSSGAPRVRAGDRVCMLSSCQNRDLSLTRTVVSRESRTCGEASATGQRCLETVRAGPWETRALYCTF